MTQTKFHVNQNSGDYGPCRAEENNCPLGSTGKHFDNKQDAMNNSEQVLEQLYETVSTPAQKTVRVDRVDVNEDFSHPQANRLDKVSTTVDAVANGANTASSISQALDVVDRQGFYYGDAAGYLGFVDASDSGDFKEYSLTPKGEIFAERDAAGREEMIRETIANMPLMQVYREEGEDAAKEFIRDTQDSSEGTADRKITTLRAWEETLSSAMSESIENDRIDSESRFVNAAEYAATQRQKRSENLQKTELRGTVCTGCFMEKALDGSCGNCD